MCCLFAVPFYMGEIHRQPPAPCYTPLMRILGLDPGLATSGYAILDVNAGQKRLVTCGVLRTPPKTPLGKRLLELHQDLQKILQEFHPDVCSIEQIFFSKNVTTGIQVSQARGVMLLALEQALIPIHEWSPSAMKRALTGDGGADKRSIQKMVMMELKLASPPQPDDAADAVSLALSLASILR